MLAKVRESLWRYSRCLVILASRPHDDVGRRSSRLLGLLICVVARKGRLGQAENGARSASQVSPRVRGEGVEQTRGSFLGQVGLLQDTLGGVDVRKIHDCGRMARVEDGSETDTLSQRLHDVVVNLVIDNVASLLVVDWVDALVVSVILVTVLVFDLSAVA